MSELKAFEVTGKALFGRTFTKKVYLKSDVDKLLADLEESHKKEVEQLLMKIVGLEKLVETADKLVKQKGGFTIKDITFDGLKLEGFKKEAK